LLNAQAAINELHTQKAKTTAESPFSGIVLDWLVRPGQNVMPGQPLLMIGDDNTEVRADVVEDDLRRGIREGSSVRIALSANLFHYTKVSKVSPISNSRSRVFNVTMALPAEFNDLSGRGSSALVEFISKSHEEVVAVPSEAIADRHSDPHIFLVSANIARKEKISLGIEQDGWIEVIDSAKTIEELNDKEEFWVKKYNSDATGYNIKPGGGNRKLAESTKQKIGLATKKRWENKEIAEKMLAGLRKGTESAIKNQKGKLKVSRIKITCQICNSVFEDRTAKNRKFCSKKCAAKNASIIAKLKNENVC